MPSAKSGRAVAANYGRSKKAIGLSKRGQTPFHLTNAAFPFSNTGKFEFFGLLKAGIARNKLSKRTPEPMI